MKTQTNQTKYNHRELLTDMEMMIHPCNTLFGTFGTRGHCPSQASRRVAAGGAC
jgi:hypothetical protein